MIQCGYNDDNHMAKKIRVAINGFGRIGRQAAKIALENKAVDLVAINDLTDNETLAHLFKYDTVYGHYPKAVTVGENHIVFGKKKVAAFSEREPERLPWAKLKVDVVIEATGAFRTEEGASRHFAAGARKVIVSAPGKGGNVPTFVRGVNDPDLKKTDRLINNASCTTNCISPIMSILESRLGIRKAMMTTVHGYTADQRLQDAPHKDLRRARAATLNIVPTTTGAAAATTEVIPSLKKKFDGIAIRVPVPVGSLSDFTILVKKKTSAEEINSFFIEATKNPLYRGILRVEDDPIVSSDIIADPHSAIVDLGFTKVVDGDLVKILAWYDNEYGYSHRLVEMVVELGKR